ncbi:MAG: acylphosphatase [Acidimicrobiales bacterium]
MDAPVIRRRVVVEGRVQGVFYRDACRREAVVAGVAGWARNLDDGRVEVVAEGAPEAVERLVSWCRRGPSHALVTAVHVRDERAEGVRGFSVR